MRRRVRKPAQSRQRISPKARRVVRLSPKTTVTPPAFPHSIGGTHADKKDLSGPALAQRAMGPREQLAQDRARQREGGSRQGMRAFLEQHRAPRAAVRARAALR